MFNFNRKEKGQGLVEYALILVLIAIVVIVAMQVLGNKVSDTFGTVNSALTRGEPTSSCYSYWSAESAAFAAYNACTASCDDEWAAYQAAVSATNTCEGF